MKHLIFIFFLNLLACSKTNITGTWEIKLDLQGQTLPLILEITQKDKDLKAKLINGAEEIELMGVLQDKQFILDFSQSYAKFEGEISSQNLKGYWIRTNKENFKVPFSGQKTHHKKLFEDYKQKENLFNLAGEWKVKLKEDKYGLGSFKQTGSYLEGSILTETGDYRFMHGFIENDTAKLYGFDGVFSFVFDFKIKKDEFIATMYAGADVKREIHGTRDANFKLTNPNDMTKATTDRPVEFKHISIDGEEINFGTNLQQAKVVQIFGSWCPNCIDETRFFLNWRKDNPEKLNHLQFIAVSFEFEDSEKNALKNLKKMKKNLNMDYPIVLAAFDKTKTVEDFFPIDKNRAFPTTLFLDKNNKIIKIHTGFSGQATGEYFEKFKTEFNLVVNQMIQ